MCGRIACTLNPEEIQKCCRFKGKNGQPQSPPWKGGSRDEYRPSHNRAPQSCTPVLVSSKHVPRQCSIDDDVSEVPERTLQTMRWGLVPSWFKGDLKEFGLSTNNARSDSLMIKASYKNPLNRGKRCVVLADGFFEWKTSKDKKKQPYYIYFKKEDIKQPDSKDSGEDDKRLLTMAGVFDCWKPNDDVDDNGLLYSFAIITVDASSSFDWLHHRMPAVLDGDDAVRHWLDYENVPIKQALHLLKPVTDCLDWHPVTTLMNNSRYHESNCITPIDLSDVKKPSKGSLMSWLVKSPKKEIQTNTQNSKRDSSSIEECSPAKKIKITEQS